jgi:predicted transcriptional regulator
MAPPVRLPGGDLEYAVLHEVWTCGDATTREVYERVGEPRGVVYTTIAKVLDRLHAKGLVTREREGKMFRYAPRRKREVVERARVRAALAQILNPEVRPAIATLVDAVESLDPELLDELARQIAARRKSRHGS